MTLSWRSLNLPSSCRNVAGFLFIGVAFFMLSTLKLSGQSTGSLAGTVADPQGAVIPQSTITVIRVGGSPISVTADAIGHYTISGLKPGLYTVQAQAEGFRSASRPNIAVNAGVVKALNLTLEIGIQQQQVVVTADSTDPTSQERNGGAVVLRGSDLAALSNNQEELQQQLEGIAGADPETGTNFYIDGFSGGKLPPKSSIREIRINQNPYSAQYDSIGWGRIEILTKPGADRLHGEFTMQGNNSPFNALNPFVKTQPAYDSYQYEGNLSGPITKSSSWFAGFYNQHSNTDSIINAEILDSGFNPIQFTQGISTPSSSLSFSPRYDVQIGKVHTLSIRYQLQRNTQTNGGVGQSALATQGSNSTNTEQVFQISDDQAWTPNLVNQTRFQYIRDRNNQIALASGPTISVQGAFTSGGSAAGTSHDNQDHYELQDYLQFTKGNHQLNLGGRFRAMRDSNYSTGSFNGQYTFATLDAYKISVEGIKNGLTPAQIRAAGGGASQYSQILGTPSLAVSLLDTGLYAEDNWKLRPNITLSYGTRFETQTDIPDHADFGPRAALSWAINGKDKKPFVTLRLGSGFFYQRFPASSVLQSRRQNGTTEKSLYVSNPDFYPADCVATPTVCTASSSAAGSQASVPSRYQINPNLRSPYSFQAGFGLDKPLGKIAGVSANYTFSRGQHQFLTRNINAPLPGTYNPAVPNSGSRPLGVDENIYEFDSSGTSTRSRFTLNGHVNSHHLSMWSYYSLSKVDTNSSGLGGFPSNSYNLRQDFGRASWDYRNRLVLGGDANLPWKISVNPFVILQSSAPFNIVVGQDLNGDTQFNDRPAFATDLTRPSVYKTKYGTFDANPLPGQSIIPINYGKGPALVLTNLRIAKSFSFGPEIHDDDPPSDAPKPSAATAAKKVKQEIERRYELAFGANFDNILNHPNYASPVGVLGSPLFGKSTSLASVWGDATSGRVINLQMSFRF